MQVSASRVDAHRQDNKILAFQLSGSQWVADADTPYQLSQAGSQWQLVTPGDEIETYDAQGTLLGVTSKSGRTSTLAYSDGTASGPNGGVYEDKAWPLPPGKLLRVTDFRGRSLSFFYSTNGGMTRMTDPAGGTYRYTYAASTGLPTSVQYPDNGTRTYVYNELANTSGVNQYYALTGIIDENGSRFATYKYYSNRKALSTEHAGGVDKYSFTYGSGSTSYTDPLGTTRSSPYSTILGVMQVTGTTQTCPGCGGSSTESYTFDASRNLSSHKDFQGNLTCYTFGARNLETARTEGLSGTGTCAARVTTPATRTITTEWHPTRRMPRRIAEPLKITTYSYHGESGVSCAPANASTALLCSKAVQGTTDADGSEGFSATSDGAPRLTSYSYNEAGQVLTVDGPRADVTDVTTYTYYASDDPSGNYRVGDLASITNAIGQTTQMTHYDGAGRLLRSVDANGVERLVEYWPRGWLKSRRIGTASAGYEATTYSYDDVGQLTQVTMPDGSYVSYTYDAAHRLTRVTDGLGNRIEYTLDNMGNRTAESAYDTGGVLSRAHGRVIDALNRFYQDIGGTNPASQVTQHGFDANGNVTSILDPLGRTTTQEYDALNRLTAVKDPFNGASNPTSYQYNQQGALTQVTDPTGLSTTYTVNGHGETLTQVSPDTGATTFTYDAAGNMASKVDARNVTATYSYDALNRLTQIVYPDETVTYAYDSCANGVGRMCSITDGSGTTSYAYDLWGRVTSKSQTVEGLTQSMGYAYNAAGQLATVTTPSGRQVVYAYANNRPSSITVDGTTLLHSALYEPFGPNGGWTWGNSTPASPNTHTRLFDKDFRATRVTSDRPVSASQPDFDREFSWDAASRVTAITDLANSALSAAYGYDALDRVTSATQGTASWGYSYNGIGDRVTSTVGALSTSYAYFPAPTGCSRSRAGSRRATPTMRPAT